MKNKNKLRYILSGLIIITVLIMALFAAKTGILRNDKEEIAIEFAENIQFAKSLKVFIKPRIFDQKGAKYTYIFEDLYIKDTNKMSSIVMRLRKRLPFPESIKCEIRSGDKINPCLTTIPENFFPEESGYLKPILFQEPLLEHSDLIISYDCKECNPGALEIKLDNPERTKINEYLIDINTFWHIVQDVYEEGLDKSETDWDYKHVHFKGTKLKSENDKLYFRVSAMSFFKQGMYVVAFAILAGLGLYWLEYKFRIWEPRKK